MIWSAILNFIISIFGAMVSWLPDVTELPWGTDEFLSNSVSYFKLIAGVFPPFELMLNLALIYITFLITLTFLKVLLGSRVPTIN